MIGLPARTFGTIVMRFFAVGAPDLLDYERGLFHRFILLSLIQPSCDSNILNVRRVINQLLRER